MKKCELCNSLAKIYCESDQASLCLDCDSKVHGANFLVAKHSRTLLCHVCQSPTPWTGSGPKLGPTVSICEHCVNNNNNCREGRGNEESRDDGEGDDDDNDSEEEDDDDDTDSDGGDEDDEENQVVPWSSTPPPPVSSSSTSEECSSKFCNGEEGISEFKMVFPLKRMRENIKDHLSGLSTQQKQNTNLSNLRPLKDHQRTARTGNAEAESRFKIVINSLRFTTKDKKSTKIPDICK